jgi:hypothetical protein
MRIFHIMCIIFFVTFMFMFYFVIQSHDRAFDIIKSESMKHDQHIEDIAEKIRSNCKHFKTPVCYAQETKYYVEKKINFRDREWLESVLMLGMDTETTIDRGNNCVGIAVFSASILNELSINNTYAMFQIGHVSIGVDTGEGMTFIYKGEGYFNDIKKIR